LFRFLILAGIGFLLWRTLAPSIRGVSDVDRARKMLGVSSHASRDEIIAAHRRLVTRVHPDSGGSEGLAAELNSARDLLLRTQQDR